MVYSHPRPTLTGWPRFLLLCLPLLCGCLTPGTAPRIPQGSIEIRGSVGMFNSEQDDANNESDEIDVEGQLLYALTPFFEIGPTIRVRHESEDIGGVEVKDDQQQSIGVMGLVNLVEEGYVIPYGAVSVGYSFFDVNRGFIDDESGGVFVNVAAGARVMVAESAALHGEFRYTHQDLETDIGGDIDEVGVFFGLSIFFGGTKAPAPQPALPTRRRFPGEFDNVNDPQRIWLPK